MELFNLHVDINSFFRKAPKKINDNFGVALICGYQGSGKTYFASYLLYNNLKDKKIYTNIKSLSINGREIEYFEKIDDIVDNIESDRIFVIDEISKKYTKDCKQDKLFYSWLQQSRKRRRIVLLITQEYIQVPIWLRGVSRFVYTTSKIRFLPLFKTDKGIAVLTEDKEWSIDPLETYIYKRNKVITNLYDTMEPVQTL